MKEKTSGDEEKWVRIGKRALSAFLSANAEQIGKYASIYAGRGAEHDDLKQEAYLAVISLLRQHSKKKVKQILKNSLKTIVSRSAYKMRYRKGDLRLSRDEGDLESEYFADADEFPDARAEADSAEVEEMDALERALPPDDLYIARLLADGWRQTEIADELGISQQAVTARIKKIRRALRDMQK
jgi:RNA polymerase sigma factor (sigma-70 family)